MAFSLGPSAGPKQAAPQKFAPGNAAIGPSSFGQFANVTEGHVDPSWLSALHDWWQRHSYYPEQAIALQQDGTVRIEIVVNKYGNVTALRMVDRSGSQWLDLATQSVFRGAKLPSLLPFTSDEQITVALKIQYILLHP
jgi:TonB family protein